MCMHGARAAHDLLVTAVPARDVDADGDRLGSLVGDDDALAHPAGALDGSVHGRERLAGRCGGTTLSGLGAFLQASGTAADSLDLALGHPLGVAVLGCAAGAGVA